MFVGPPHFDTVYSELLIERGRRHARVVWLDGKKRHCFRCRDTVPIGVVINHLCEARRYENLPDIGSNFRRSQSTGADIVPSFTDEAPYTQKKVLESHPGHPVFANEVDIQNNKSCIFAHDLRVCTNLQLKNLFWTLSNSITVDKPHQKGAPCLKVCTRTRM